MGLLDKLRTKAQALNVYFVDDQRFGNIFGTTNVSPDKLIENFNTIPDLFTITNFLAKRVSKIPVKTVSRYGKDKPSSELNKLIEKPNFYQSWKELVKNDYAYYNILGNSYLYGIRAIGFGGQITSIFSLPADKTQVILARSKDLPNWMNEVAGYQIDLHSKKYQLAAEDVLHNRFFNLRYDSGQWIYGISKYVAGDKINTELKAIYDSKTSIINNRGALGVLSNESNIPDKDETEIVQKRLAEAYGLKSDQKKFIVTTQKLTYQQMGLGVAELQLIENGKYSFEKLCQLSEFDPVIFSTEGSTFANKNEAIKDLYKNVIKGDTDEFYDNLNMWIGDGYNGDKIVPDWDKVQELENDKKIYTEMLVNQIKHAMITPRKANEILYGEFNGTEEEMPPDKYFVGGINEYKEVEDMPEEQVIEPNLIEALAKEEEQKTNDNGETNKEVSV